MAATIKSICTFTLPSQSHKTPPHSTARLHHTHYMLATTRLLRLVYTDQQHSDSLAHPVTPQPTRTSLTHTRTPSAVASSSLHLPITTDLYTHISHAAAAATAQPRPHCGCPASTSSRTARHGWPRLHVIPDLPQLAGPVNHTRTLRIAALKWRNIWIRDVFCSAPLVSWGQNTSRIKHKPRLESSMKKSNPRLMYDCYAGRIDATEYCPHCKASGGKSSAQVTFNLCSLCFVWVEYIDRSSIP